MLKGDKTAQWGGWVPLDSVQTKLTAVCNSLTAAGPLDLTEGVSLPYCCRKRATVLPQVEHHFTLCLQPLLLFSPQSIRRLLLQWHIKPNTHFTLCFLMFQLISRSLRTGQPHAYEFSHTAADAVAAAALTLAQMLRLKANRAIRRKHKLGELGMDFLSDTRGEIVPWRKEQKKKKVFSLKRKLSATCKLAAPRLPFSTITVIISCITVAGHQRDKCQCDFSLR